MKKNKHPLSKSLTFMLTARAIDKIEVEYTARGEAFFHVSGVGHEGLAVLAPFLTETDWIHSHYRDKALLLARGVSPEAYFLALFNKKKSHSLGRQMNAHMSAPEFNVLSTSGPVGNSTLHAAGVAAVLKKRNDSSVVVNILGEGTTFQGEFLEAMALAARDSLPMLLVVEDNKFAISTKTEGKTFYQVGDRAIDHFMGIPILRIDGRHPEQAYEQFATVFQELRETSAAKIVVFSVERLESHTNADNQKIYRSQEEIDAVRKNSDPILNLISHLYELDIPQAEEKLEELLSAKYKELKSLAEQIKREEDPEPEFGAKRPFTLGAKKNEKAEEGPLVMLEAIREVLHSWLEKDKKVLLYGQDIEDPKGDVFGVTKGLSTAFPDRVQNSPLSESLILGTSIGKALAGMRPVAFLQFADFFPLAFNQIYSELGSMYWRTGGGWQVPVIVLATCGGYKPGLGPFHASSMESVAAHVSGIDVFIPSNARDAAGLLNTAFLSQRPTVFFYPKNLLNVQHQTISKKSARTLAVEPGTASVVQAGRDITLVGFGNTVRLCMQVAETLAKAGRTAEVIDLRSLQPLDYQTVLQSAEKTGRLLVTHEDTLSVSISSEVVAQVSERSDKNIAYARLARPDTYVPCNFANQLEILPSYKRILEESVRLLGGTLKWKEMDSTVQEGQVDVKAIGSSPSDEVFVITQWMKKEGEHISEGEILVEAEADKSVVELKSRVSGTLVKLLHKEGDSVPIGEVIARIQTEERVVEAITKEEIGEARIHFPDATSREGQSVQSSASSRSEAISPAITAAPAKSQQTAPVRAYISHIKTVLGARVVDNVEMSKLSPEWVPEKIYTSTGIKKRHWLSEDQKLVSISTEVAKKSLDSAGLSIVDIDGIICATGTHEYQTPSLATIVQYELEKLYGVTSGEKEIFGYDVSAACSGFVFVLSDVYHRIRENPGLRFLLITGEYLSSRMDLSDYQTAPVFSDAATASILSSQKGSDAAEVYNPLLQTVGAPAELLMVPEQGTIAMNGLEVYKLATQHLSVIAEKICKIHNLTLQDIDLVIPHQANQKIIRIVAKRLNLPLEKFYINIDVHGNSSSNTIPICLEELQAQNALQGKTVLLIAFGGGFTFGGTILKY